MDVGNFFFQAIWYLLVFLLGCVLECFPESVEPIHTGGKEAFPAS